ncbi:gustatory receptor for sugar taste 64f [Halyomorpha halys]|uniref:gustatory receptor for sugar taste 64f n=1 Tax=Halyomorpha halys TaxID=286706 RepID=UPI0006D4FEC6|nr:gustatory receptor for sugar taste 64f-like [Halyomorpha halys]
MTLGLVEHLFHNWVNTKDGDMLEKNPVGNYLKTFSFRTHNFLVDETSYCHWKGVIIVMFSFHGTLLWTFIDVFIILVTSGLRGQLVSWNKFAYNHVKVSDFCWKTFRRDYFKIINFIKAIDKNINKIIGLSMVNFYFISTQLLEEVRTQHDKYSERLFFLFSFSSLLLRTVLSFMSSASVHDEWLKVSTPIHACLSHTPQVERLLAEVHSDHVAMSAFNMFHITRGLIMAMCGVVLTYELLILETHEAENMAKLQNDSMSD